MTACGVPMPNSSIRTPSALIVEYASMRLRSVSSSAR